MNEWVETQLENITSKIGSGATPRGGANSYKESGISLIRSQNVLDFQFTTSGLAFIDDEQAAALQNVEVLKNDVLLNITGDSVARCCIVPDFVLPARVNQHVAIIRLEPYLADYRFIFYYLQYLKNELLMQAEIGATRRALTKGMLQELEILLPSLTEQHAISEVFSSHDDKIDLLHRQNETLEALAQTLFRQWFVEEAEERWDVGVIPDEFDFTMGLSPPGTSYNEEAIGTPMFQGNADFTFRFPRKRVFTTDPRRFAEKFDTLISVRAPVGAQNMALEKCCIGRGVAAFRYKRNPRYFSYTYYKINSIMAEIRQFEDAGTVFGSINKSDFETLEITIPPTELVDKFEDEVSPLDEKIYRNCLQIRTLEKLRDTLLPKLMSGEVRV